MADTLKADIAKELNITARRNDSFKLKLQVKDAAGTLVMNGTNSGSIPKYQAKMTIINSSGDKVLNVYTYYWNNVVPGNSGHDNNAEPTSSVEGHYSPSGAAVVDGIYLASQTDANDATQAATITIPYTHMDFQSGSYKYDLQIRLKDGDNATVDYTTWLYGTFTLNADITQV